MNKRLKSVSELTPGQWVRYWHDTVAFGWTPVYRLVVEVTPKTVTLQTERGELYRKTNAKIHLYETVGPREVVEILNEYPWANSLFKPVE